MAGAGFKDFAVGEVLTATDVDTYLMQQSVMRFADAAARGSALGTATGTAVPLAEGMVSYLDDANYVQVFDGTKWRDPSIGIGTNAVEAVYSTSKTISSTSYTDTDLSVTITPTSSSSLVLVIFNQTLDNVRTGTVGETAIVRYRLLRDATEIHADTAFQYLEATGTDGDRQLFTRQSVILVDNPATTSSVTYKSQASLSTTSGSASVTFQPSSAPSYAVAIEVAA